MNEIKKQVSRPIEYKKMHVYKLLRTEEKDKTGRPAVLWKRFGKESLIWSMTTIKKEGKEIPVKTILGNSEKTTYFYINGLEKIKTKELIKKWKNTNDSGEIIEMVLPNEVQKQLINKFANYTNQKKPYITIDNLKIQKEKVKEENEKLKNENQIKNETIKELKIYQKQLKNENKIAKINNQKLKQENSKLKNEIQIKNRIINNQETINNRKKTTIKNQEGQIKNLKNSLIKKDLEFDNLKNKHAILESEYKLIKNQMENENSSEYERE